MDNLENSILKTLTYFDLFDYPLTLLEIQKWLWETKEEDLNKIKQVLNNSPQIESREGFYYLQGRGDIVRKRKNRYVVAQKKFKKRLPYIRLLTWLPHVKAIFVVNNLAIANAGTNSDIDLMIISPDDKIWTTRMFTTTLMKIFGLRPTQEKNKDQLCLSIYLTEKNLNLEDYKINPDDIHFTYWADQIFPVYDPDNLEKKYIKANAWIKNKLPASIGYQAAWPRTINRSGLNRFMQSFLSLASFENAYKKWQLKNLPQNLKDMMNKDTRVVVNDKILKFHDNDPRAEILQKWEQKIQQI
ncbi:hypothetical protein KKC88_04555 [Patescibacteria group bacterium]|nr:hypothetical protein [Patescibacteria group bacterium]MBU1674002.1 hypothetical protein [Patescibacteria group bacterium]MBU1962925.1 hypothetical protein [Patescibacteria group bacterium]